MDYWAETMQDDCYLIAADGWVEGAQPREIVRSRTRTTNWSGPRRTTTRRESAASSPTSFPRAILIARYFVAERDAIEALEAELAALEQQLDEMREENSGEEGLLAEVIEGEGDKQKITAKVVKARLKEIGKDAGLRRRTQGARRLRSHLLDKQSDAKAKLQGRAGRPGRQDRRQIPEAHRGRDQDARGRRQMAGHARRRRAGRTGPRLANAHRPHPPTGRTLRHAAAAAHRRSRRRSPPAWTNTSRRWERYGSEAPATSRPRLASFRRIGMFTHLGHSHFERRSAPGSTGEKHYDDQSPTLLRTTDSWDRIDRATSLTVPMSRSDIELFG